MKIRIIPTPQILEHVNGTFNFSPNSTISISDVSLNFTANEIIKSLEKAFDVHLKIVSSRADIELKIVKNLNGIIKINSDVYDQAYQLSIDENKIVIKSTTARGVFYGAMSLIQMIDKCDNNSLQCVNITDWPDMKVRGISDDISRGQVSTLTNFKRIIKFIARYKMNTYMPYLEDMIQFEAYPTIGQFRGALSKEEIREIVDFAEKHFVEVIPVFQTLGHYDNILTQPEFVEYADFPGAASLDVTNEKTYQFLESMLKEVFELFPSKYINIGADESYDVGHGNSKELVNKSSLAEVHAQHYKRVYDICKKYGKNVMMYGDILLHHREILEMLPRDIIIVDWHYRATASFNSTMILKEAGLNYIVSPAVWNFLTTFPTYQIALPNIQHITKEGISNNSIGMINSNWGDYGAETFKEFVLPGYAWSAQCSWNYEASSISDFNNSFFYDFFGIDDQSLNSIYKIFSNQFNQMTWHEIWRHPLLDLRKPGWWETNSNWVEVMNWMESTLPNTYEIIDKFQPIVKQNSDHFDLLRFMVYFNYWYIQKLKTQYYLTQKTNINEWLQELEDNDSEEELEEKIRWAEKQLEDVDLYVQIDKNIEQLEKLKIDYQKLWLKYYKEENLYMIVDKFNRLISYFEETKSELKRGRLINPQIESKWIYCLKNRRRNYDKAIFKKEIVLNEKITSAFLQLLGDTHAKLYINGNYVDEVYAKRTLSLLVDYRRIKFLDISEYLKTGKNKIEVRVEKFRGNSGGGFNLIAEIKTSNRKILITSDESWKSKPAESKNAKWRSAVSKDYRYIVIAPNFETKRTSWIER